MRWIKDHKLLFTFILVAIVALPFVLELLIFDNSVPSNVSNDGWAGFFGGYIGAIIGAVATIVAISLEISYSEKRRREDEVRAIRPYLCIQDFKWVTHGTSTTNLRLPVQNVGFHAACNISLHTNNPDKERKTLYAKHLTLAANNQSEINITIDSAESERYEFFYFDIRGNSYTQELIIESNEDNGVRHIVSCSTLEPCLYRDRAYYEQIGFKKKDTP